MAEGKFEATFAIAGETSNRKVYVAVDATVSDVLELFRDAGDELELLQGDIPVRNDDHFANYYEPDAVYTIKSKASFGAPGTILRDQLRELGDLGAQIPVAPELLISKGRGAWDFSEFREAAGGKSRTLLLIESSFGSICGGFAAAPWSLTSHMGSLDETLMSFIFHLGRKPRRFNLIPALNAISTCWRDQCFMFGCDDVAVTADGDVEVRNEGGTIRYEGPDRVLKEFTGTANGKAPFARWELWQL